jgi:neutral ceramidase
VQATLFAGAAVADISPRNAQFLFGYPHVPRYSTGIHDPLLSCGLYLNDGVNDTLFIANDLIYVSKAACRRMRQRLTKATGILDAHIMITATHTHSGPVTVDILSSASDPVVPPPDPEYLRYMEDQIVKCGVEAYRSARPARIGLAVTSIPDNHTNRHDPKGPRDPQIPVLAVQDAESSEFIACMVVYSLHPTALHESSTLVSADFPGTVRQHLQDAVLGKNCPVLYHTGPSGNQSPRYILRSNNFRAAEQLGQQVGAKIAEAIPRISFLDYVPISCAREQVQLVPRKMPTVEEATTKLEHAVSRLEHLRQTGAAPEVVRTAECDWFGAEETLTLAKAAQDGRLQSAYEACLPCEIQAVRLGPWVFVAWQGEVFVEYALLVKEKYANVFVISLANGELQGYIATEEAVLHNRYEAGNAIFHHSSGMLLVAATERLLAQLRDGSKAPCKAGSPERNG